MFRQSGPPDIFKKLSFVFLVFEIFPMGALAEESPWAFVPPMATKTPTLPANEAGYYYSASHDPVAYAANAVTMIQIKPINLELLPTLVLDLPEEISLLGAVRAIDLLPPVAIERDGISYRRYRARPRSKNSSKFICFWRSDLKPGSESTAYFHAEWEGGKQPEQSLKVKTISLPQKRLFKKIPVWYTIPSDLAECWSSPEDYRRGGFNTVDLWSYLSEGEKKWGEPLLKRVTQDYRKAGLEVWAWPQDWWWPRGRETPEGQSTGIEGKRHAELSLNYRGKFFKDWIAAGKILVDLGIYTHTSDPEIYRNVDEKVGFSALSKDRFKSFLKSRQVSLPEADPSVFMKEPEKHSQAVSLWREWKAKRYTDFFVEYRGEMERYMKGKGIEEPFRYIIYSTYHRHWESFYGSDDFRSAPPYTITLEDPLDLTARAFDILSPMTYPDLYATAEAPELTDNTRPWKDTYSLDQLTGNRGLVMPLLSSGYPYCYYERDISAEMLRHHILESIAGGAKGFGFWGEGIHDARDMQTVGALVDQLVPAESIILKGVPFVDQPVEGVAFVKGVKSSEGALILVSEYSEKERLVKVRSPMAGKVVDLETGKDVARFAKSGGSFEVRLSSLRSKMFMVKKP